MEDRYHFGQESSLVEQIVYAVRRAKMTGASRFASS